MSLLLVASSALADGEGYGTKCSRKVIVKWSRQKWEGIVGSVESCSRCCEYERTISTLNPAQWNGCLNQCSDLVKAEYDRRVEAARERKFAREEKARVRHERAEALRLKRAEARRLANLPGACMGWGFGDPDQWCCTYGFKKPSQVTSYLKKNSDTSCANPRKIDSCEVGIQDGEKTLSRKGVVWKCDADLPVKCERRLVGAKKTLCCPVDLDEKLVRYSPYGEDCLRGRILAPSAGRKPLPQNTGAACELARAPADAPTSGEFWECLMDPNPLSPPNVQGVISGGSGTLESGGAEVSDHPGTSGGSDPGSSTGGGGTGSTGASSGSQ